MLTKDDYLKMKFLIELCEIESMAFLDQELFNIKEDAAVADLDKSDMFWYGYKHGVKFAVQELRRCLNELREKNGL